MLYIDGNQQISAQPNQPCVLQSLLELKELEQLNTGPWGIRFLKLNASEAIAGLVEKPTPSVRLVLGVCHFRSRNYSGRVWKQRMMIQNPSVESKTQSSPSWYQRLFAWVMAHGNAKYEEEMADRTRALFADLHGNVLEIGSGTGPNLSYYPPNIHWIGVEPNRFMHPYLKQEAEQLGLDIDLRSGTAEHLEAEDNSMNAVVSTLVLCSVGNLTAVLQEVVRVLKPGGRFFFLEHVAAPQGTWLRRVQH